MHLGDGETRGFKLWQFLCGGLFFIFLGVAWGVGKVAIESNVEDPALILLFYEWIPKVVLCIFLCITFLTVLLLFFLNIYGAWDGIMFGRFWMIEKDYGSEGVSGGRIRIGILNKSVFRRNRGTVVVRTLANPDGFMYPCGGRKVLPHVLLLVREHAENPDSSDYVREESHFTVERIKANCRRDDVLILTEVAVGPVIHQV